MLRPKLGRRKRNNYTKMMKTLLIQNQQIIMQQQNMMFMVIKQFQQSQPQLQQTLHQPLTTSNHQQPHSNHHQQQPQPMHQTHQQQTTTPSSIHETHQHQQSSSQQQHHHIHHHQQQPQQQPHQHHHHHLIQNEQTMQSHHLYTIQSTPNNVDTQQQLLQVSSQLQENLGNYLTPAASEQDPISDDKQEEDDLVTLIENDVLMQNNLLYNPQTDIGSITPYKSHQSQHQTPSYYSSGCESLTTPRVEQRQPTTTNISQNVVKNLADSFKSPSKPKINVQILSGTATKNMKNSKAKIIQRMNISEFLRHVHPEKEN